MFYVWNYVIPNLRQYVCPCFGLFALCNSDNVIVNNRQFIVHCSTTCCIMRCLSPPTALKSISAQYELNNPLFSIALFLFIQPCSSSSSSLLLTVFCSSLRCTLLLLHLKLFSAFCFTAVREDSRGFPLSLCHF